MSQLKRLQNKLREEKLDALLVTSPENRFFATGFESSAGVVFITAEEGYFSTDFRYIEAAEKKVKDYNLVMTTREKGYFALLNEWIEKSGAQKIGFEEGTMTVVQFNAYRKHLPGTFVPAQNCFEELRASKQEEEIREVEKSQGITDRAFSDMLSVIQEGMTEKEISAKLTYALLHQGAQQMAFEPIVVSGPNSSLPHGVPGERAVKKGDFITMDFGARQSGYCADMTRTIALGEASDEMRNIYEIVLKAQLAGIEKAKAGIPGKEIDAAGRKVIEEAGYGDYFGHGFGHGLGILVHEGPGASASEERILPVGQIISAEPGIYIPEKFGVRIEDILLLEADGNRDLTHSCKDLIIL